MTGGGNFSTAVFELIGWAKAQGRLQELIEQAHEANYGNPELSAFAEKWNGGGQASATQTPTAPATSPPIPNVAGQTENAVTSATATPAPVITPTPGPIEVFYSYSHQDEKLRKKLETALANLKNQNLISGWTDRRITAGSEWAGEIDAHLNSARLILLLVSPDFMASNYCYGIEAKRAMERHNAGEALVVPIMLRPTDWQGVDFARLQALPIDAKPVTDWASRDKAFLDIAQGLRKAIQRLTTA